MTVKAKSIIWCLAVLILFSGIPAWADDATLKPFVLGYQGEGTIDTKLAEVKSALEHEGFQIVGEYTPYKGAHIIVVTDDSLRNIASRSDFGAYGAIQRISLTETDKGIQVAYTNPLYLAHAYRLSDSLAAAATGMEKALGMKEFFGSAKGIMADKLRSYHYMMFMPYFTDQVVLARHRSHEEALDTVEKNLQTGAGGTVRVYRVDLPGKNESVFGIGIKEGKGSDQTVMNTVDFGELKQTAHLPYELVVSNGTVYMLHGKFRIAVDFPDLSMGTFMKISGAPSAIEAALKQVAGGK